MDRTESTRRVRFGIRGAAVAGFSLGVVALAGAADGDGFDLATLADHAAALGRSALAWYARTPAADRMTWGGLAASTVLGLGVTLERLARLRQKKVLPAEFTGRFLDRLRDGKLDRGKALDFCELNPSPASRVALAAVKRWGRPAADLERAVALAHRVEAEKLRRNVGTLRRMAALAPLLGLLGTLFALGRALNRLGVTETAGAWGPALASALGPLTAGVAVAVLALVAYDGLTVRAEGLVGALDLAGAQILDAVAMTLPTGAGPARTPHQARVSPAQPAPRPVVEDDSD